MAPNKGKIMTKPYEKEILEALPQNWRARIILEYAPSLPAPAASARVKNYIQQDYVLLLYNPRYIQQVNDRVTIPTIVQHEILHALCGHLDIMRNENLRKRFNNSDRFLIAIDCEVNSHLPNLWPLPPTHCCHAGHYNLPHGHMWRWYYDHLPQKTDQNNSNLQLCHRKELTLEQTKKIEKLINQACKKYSLQRTKANTLTPPQTNTKPPKQLLAQIERLLTANCENYYTKTRSWSRPHKWKSPGIPGITRNRGARILIAVDISGSTTGAQQQAYLRIVRRLIRDIKATIVLFHTNIEYAGRRMPSDKYQSGGTDFQCVVEYAKKAYDAIIWFTDCEGSSVTPLVPVNIVVCTGTRNDAIPGKTILYDPKEFKHD